MLEACILLAFIPVIFSAEYYQQEFSPKNHRMYYYARKIQPGYHDRMQYTVKSPFRRPYMVYVPKPYVVEVPKPVPYVKIPVPQQYFFEKQLSHPYKIEKPFYFHQLSSSLDTKLPTEVKVPIESPVSVTIEKQVLLPVNMDGEKQTESKEPSAHVTFPEEVTSHLELAMNKGQSTLSSGEKESFLEQLKASGFSQEDLKSQFVLKGEHKPLSLDSEEFSQSWSSKGKTPLEPIVVSEENQKWTSFNGSEWVPRFEISDIKTTSNERYKFWKPDKENFELSEEKYPIRTSIISPDISKYLLPEKSNYVSSPPIEPASNFKQSPFEQASKQSFDFPSSKTYQYYTIDSGKVIKPEALTSNIGKIETDLKDEITPYHQWLISKEYQKDTQNTVPEQSKPNVKWVSAQESYTSQNKPKKKWQTNNEQSVVRTEPVEQLSRGQEKYESQKKQSQHWSTQDQREAGENWTNGHGQYIIHNESGNIQAQQNDQSDPTFNWVKHGDQYIIKKNPRQQWSESEEITYKPQKHIPQFAIHEEQRLKGATDQFENEKVYSSQQFVLSHQYAPDNKEALQQANHDQRDKKYFQASQQLEGSFKPLITSHSQISYRYQIPHSENHFQESNFPYLQQDLERKPSHQQELVQSYSDHNSAQLQTSDIHTQDLPSTKEQQVYHRQRNKILNADNLQPTSNRHRQQYFRDHQYYQQSQDVQSKDHEVQSGSVQTYPQYTSSPQRHRDYWKQTSQAVYQESTGGGQKDKPSLEGDSEDGPPRQQDSGLFGQKRRQRQPSRGETRVPDQILRSNRVSITNSTEELTTTVVPSSTTTQPRRKQRRKQRRRNQETTVSTNEN